MYNNDQKIIESIRAEYQPRQENELDKLRKLDSKVKTPALVFAYILGSIGALVLGVGMCLAMKVIGDLMILGIVIGVIGIAIVSLNYFIYKALLASRRRKYAEEILSSCDKISG